jgi:hypothetical protein
MAEILAELLTQDSSEPDLFPLPDGGIQAEWHAGGHDIEIEVRADGSGYATANDPATAGLVDEEIQSPVQVAGSPFEAGNDDTFAALKKALQGFESEVFSAQVDGAI